MTGNYIIAGGGFAEFAEVVGRLSASRMLWSCGCDKAGDWYVSTQDDTDEAAALSIAGDVDARVYRGGELIFAASWLIALPDDSIWEAMANATPMISEDDHIS